MLFALCVEEALPKPSTTSVLSLVPTCADELAVPASVTSTSKWLLLSHEGSVLSALLLFAPLPVV